MQNELGRGTLKIASIASQNDLSNLFNHSKDKLDCDRGLVAGVDKHFKAIFT